MLNKYLKSIILEYIIPKKIFNELLDSTSNIRYCLNHYEVPNTCKIWRYQKYWIYASIK